MARSADGGSDCSAGTRAWSCSQRLPDSAGARDRRELDLQVALGVRPARSQGLAGAGDQVGLRRARDLCERLGEISRSCSRRCTGLWHSHHQLAGGLARRARASPSECSAWPMISTTWRPRPLGPPRAGCDLARHVWRVLLTARAAAGAGARALRSGRATALGFRYTGKIPGVVRSPCWLGRFSLPGYPDQALGTSEEAFARARRVGPSPSLRWPRPCYCGCVVHQLRGTRQARAGEAEITCSPQRSSTFPTGWRVATISSRLGAGRAPAEVEQGIAELRTAWRDFTGHGGSHLDALLSRSAGRGSR